MYIYIYIHVYTQHIQHDKTLINGIKYHIDWLEGFLNHKEGSPQRRAEIGKNSVPCSFFCFKRPRHFFGNEISQKQKKT